MSDNVAIIYYSEVRLVDDDEAPRLDFVRQPDSPAPPASMKEFRRQVGDVARMIRVLFQNDLRRRAKFFRQLHLVAWSGTVGATWSADVGLDNLDELRGNIADEFPVIRGYIWRWNLAILGFALYWAFLISLLHHATFGPWFPVATSPVHPVAAITYAVALIPLGVAIGLHAEFIFRVADDMTYAQLATINPGRWKPVDRAINTVIVAAIFAAILAKGVFQVGVANMVLNNFWRTDPLLSIGIGFVTGFGYPYVRDIIQQFKPVRRDVKG